ncbi:MAG: hypothetical protein ACREJN_11000, partial [Nitrospiraceae bacterium]
AYLGTTSIDDALRTVRGQRVLWLEMRLNNQFDLMPWQSARRCSSLSDGLPWAVGRPIVHLTPFSYAARFTRHDSWTLVDFVSSPLTKHS